jgi:hypothetical protein
MGDQFVTETRTDAEGRFTLTGMPKGEGNSVLVLPGDTQPYVAMHAGVPDPPGFGPVPVEITLTPGVWIEGTVTDKRTGKPVRLAEVEYYPASIDAKTVAKFPGLRDRYEAKGRYYPTVTRADGKFRVLGLPGKGFLVARAHDAEGVYLAATDRAGEGGSERLSLPSLPHIVLASNYHAVREVTVPAEGPFACPVALERGTSFTVSVVGPDGKPIRGAESYGAAANLRWEGEQEPGRHPVTLYNPGRPRLVLFRHAADNLVGTLSVPKDFDAAATTVKLERGVVLTGRVVDEDGQPRAGVEVSLSFQRLPVEPWGAYTVTDRIVTDAAGRFRVGGVVPGFKYGVTLRDVHVESFTLGADATGTKDLGDLRLAK